MNVCRGIRGPTTTPILMVFHSYKRSPISRPLPLDVPALDSSSPTPTTTTTTIAHAAVGKRHSLLLTRGGEVWSFGSGLYHALGHGRTDNEWAPRRVAALEGVGEMRPGRYFMGRGVDRPF